MKNLKTCRALGLVWLVGVPGLVVHGQSIEISPQTIVEAHNVLIRPLDYRGKSSVEIRDASPQLGDNVPRMVLMKDVSLGDGTIEISMAGDTAADAPANFRGFVGIAFRIASDRSRYECIYLRPKNGRSPDPLQRGHSVQYESEPDFPWDRLRADTPGKYEAYADLVPGAWTHVRIQIAGKRAVLFVNDATKPALTVNDLIGTVQNGPIALWVGPGTIAHFAELKVTRQ
jgi:hypothetical protein